MLQGILIVATIYCAYRVVRAARLLNVSLWLAVTSALAATLIYTLGAPQVAVIELSVGAGLVTVLFVFAFSIVGEVTLDELTLVPRALVWGLVLAIVLAAGWFVLPLPVSTAPPASDPLSFAQVLWQQRGLDVIAQMVLIFSGVMGLLGLLSDNKPLVRRSIPEILERETENGGPADLATPLERTGADLGQSPSGQPIH
jgi:uncharacterized MnhB-related membrane protein